MRISELFAESKGNQGARGIEAVMDHISSSDRKNTYVHTSMIPKVGIKPGDNLTAGLEPVGIYAFRADDWYKANGAMYFKPLRYIHVIKLKPNTKSVNSQVYDQLVQEFNEENPDIDQYQSSGKLTLWLKKKQIGMVARKHYGNEVEYIILGREFISHIQTFDTYHLLPGAKNNFDNVNNDVEFNYDKARTGLAPYAEFLEQNPELEDELEWWYANPRNLAKIRLLLYALKNQITLSPVQQGKLVDYGNARYLQIYRKYTK
jgi:hypothetical protein